jgi:hypothetical protein
MSATDEQRASTKSGPREANEVIKVFRRIHIIAKDVYVLNPLKKALLSAPRHPMDRAGVIYVLRNPAHANALEIGFTSYSVTNRLRQWRERCKFNPILVWQEQSPHARRLERLCQLNLTLERRIQKTCPGYHFAHRQYFEANERLVRTAIKRWNRWLEKDSYDEDSNLKEYWRSRIFGTDPPRTLEELYTVIDHD